jgi:hypothetical protein
MDYLKSNYDDVLIVTYNKIIKQDLKLGLETPIKTVIVKDYERNNAIHESEIEDSIKLYVRDLNFEILNGYVTTRNMYPCFFLIN